MASGKSLELNKIKPEPSPLCICGKVWKTHLRKDGQVMARYDNDKHAPKTFVGGFNRAMRRQMRKYRG